MTTNRNENGKADEISVRKEKIINAIFTKKELNRIDGFLNEDNYIVYYLANYLDTRVNELAQNQKDFKNFTKEEVKEIFSEFSEIIKDYYNTYEFKDPQKQRDYHDLIEELLKPYPSLNFHYIELFIYFNDFLNSEEALDLDAFLLANQNLFFPYKKKESNSGAEDKKEKKLLTKIFKLLTKKEVAYSNNNDNNNDPKNSRSLELVGLLKYCVSLGSNKTEASDIYGFIDKTSNGKIKKEDFKVYLYNLLEFNFAEERKLKEKIDEKDLEDADEDEDDDNDNSLSENQIQENIDKILSDFTKKINFKKYKNEITQSEFIQILNNNEPLLDEFSLLFGKTEEVIFTKVFHFNFNSENQEEENDNSNNNNNNHHHHNHNYSDEESHEIKITKETKKNYSKRNTNETGFFKAYKEIENSDTELAPNNDKKLGSSSYYVNYFLQKNSNEKTEFRDSPSKIPKYPYNANEAIRALSKRGSLQEMAQQQNPKEKAVLSYQVSFNPKDRIRFGSNYSSSKEEKGNNNFNHNANNNHENNSESENYSPIGKLVSFQNVNNNPRTSNEDLEDENNKLNLNFNCNQNQNLNNNNTNNNNNNHKKIGANENEKAGGKNILGLKGNFDTGTASDNNNESSNDENIEEEINEYQEESNESDYDSKNREGTDYIKTMSVRDMVIKIQFITYLYDVSIEDFLVYFLKWEFEDKLENSSEIPKPAFISFLNSLCFNTTYDDNYFLKQKCFSELYDIILRISCASAISLYEIKLVLINIIKGDYSEKIKALMILINKKLYLSKMQMMEFVSYTLSLHDKLELSRLHEANFSHLNKKNNTGMRNFEQLIIAEELVNGIYQNLNLKSTELLSLKAIKQYFTHENNKENESNAQSDSSNAESDFKEDKEHKCFCELKYENSDNLINQISYNKKDSSNSNEPNNENICDNNNKAKLFDSQKNEKNVSSIFNIIEDLSELFSKKFNKIRNYLDFPNISLSLFHSILDSYSLAGQLNNNQFIAFIKKLYKLELNGDRNIINDNNNNNQTNKNFGVASKTNKNLTCLDNLNRRNSTKSIINNDLSENFKLEKVENRLNNSSTEINTENKLNESLPRFKSDENPSINVIPDSSFKLLKKANEQKEENSYENVIIENFDNKLESNCFSESVNFDPNANNDFNKFLKTDSNNTIANALQNLNRLNNNSGLKYDLINIRSNNNSEEKNILKEKEIKIEDNLSYNVSMSKDDFLVKENKDSSAKSNYRNFTTPFKGAAENISPFIPLNNQNLNNNNMTLSLNSCLLSNNNYNHKNSVANLRSDSYKKFTPTHFELQNNKQFFKGKKDLGLTSKRGSSLIDTDVYEKISNLLKYFKSFSDDDYMFKSYFVFACLSMFFEADLEERSLLIIKNFSNEIDNHCENNKNQKIDGKRISMNDIKEHILGVDIRNNRFYGIAYDDLVNFVFNFMHFILHFSKDLESKEIEENPELELSTRFETENESIDGKRYNSNADCGVKNKNKIFQATDKKDNSQIETGLNVFLKDECLIEMCEALVKHIYDSNLKSYNENLDLNSIINYAELLL